MDSSLKHVHLIGVCGTGMGALASLFLEAGYRVTGSDRAFLPPMGPALVEWGVETRPGWDPANLDDDPDLVIIGNVCRPSNPEAQAAIERGLRYLSFPGAMEEIFLAERKSFVVAGTHGKTTTTSLMTHLLDDLGLNPGYLVGGVLQNAARSARLGSKDAPFAIEGDEYDCSFFEKSPKFWRYRPWGAILTSIEHDHIDIYPDEASYLEAFAGFIERMDPSGILVAWAGDARVREIAKRAQCRVRFYALEGDDYGDVSPVWLAAPVRSQAGAQPFDLYVGGTYCGRIAAPLFGEHNIRNTVAAMALVAEGADQPLRELIRGVQRFPGVRRRQELLAEIAGIRVYDDFAHHPTAVRETIRSMRMRHPESRVLAAFEPRSATASRRLHQAEYPSAFKQATLSLLAPVGRPEIADDEKLDVNAIVTAIQATGGVAEAPPDVDSLIARLVEEARQGDTILLMSNGSFGGIYDRLLAALVKAKVLL
jgi:UDP-N-acetylmuramate: L-alanyl-gamma-D-glutamyl-meso-diaminopimelate ligase